MACRKFHQELPVYQGVNASFAWLAAPYEANSGRRLGLRIRLFLLAFRDDLADREHYIRLPPNHACTRWNDTAHIHGRPDLRGCDLSRPSQFCNRLCRRSSTRGDDTDRRESTWARSAKA